jgi:hypothetical protein
MFRREAGPLALLGPANRKHLILTLLRANVKIRGACCYLRSFSFLVTVW